MILEKLAIGTELAEDSGVLFKQLGTDKGSLVWDRKIKKLVKARRVSGTRNSNGNNIQDLIGIARNYGLIATAPYLYQCVKQGTVEFLGLNIDYA